MALMLQVPAADAGKSFVPAPEGVHPAVCVSIIDVGTQTMEFQGEVKQQRQLLIRWELDTDERMADGRPFSLSKKYTASLHPKSSLHKLLVSWFGKAPSAGAFDLQKLLGRGCQVQVIHAPSKKNPGEMNAYVQSVMPLVKGMKAPEPSVEPYSFSLDDYDDELFATFGQGLKDWIAKSPEYQAAIAPKPAPASNVAGFGQPRGKVAPSGRGADFPENKPGGFSDDLDDEIPFDDAV